MDNKRDLQSYETRWSQAKKNDDTSILAFKNPKNIPSFFYLEYNKLTLKILEELNGYLTTNTRILEIGCGRATASIYLGVCRGCQLKPIDYSQNAIDIANKNLREYNLEETAEIGDLYSFESTEKFDVVISYGVMEHMPDIKRAYKAMKAHLKPGGIMISMNVPEKRRNIQSIFAPVNRVLYGMQNLIKAGDKRPWLDKKNRGQTGNVYRTYSNSSDFAEACRQAGFIRVKQLEVNPFPTINPLPSFIEQQIVRLFGIILKIKQRVKPDMYIFECSEKISRCHFIIGEAP